MYRDQESVGSLIHSGDIQLSLQSFVNLKRVSVNNRCEAEAEQYPAAQNGQESSIAGHLTNRGECKNLQSLTMKLHPHAADAMDGVGKPSTGSPRINWASAYFNPLGGFSPYLRHLEAHRFRIKNEDLLAYLDTLKHTLHSLILSDSIFEPSVLKLFTGIREDVVPPVAIFKYSGDRQPPPTPEIPNVMTEEAITPYLVWMGMNGSLSLHDWDKQVKEYADQHSGYT